MADEGSIHDKMIFLELYKEIPESLGTWVVPINI